MGSLKLPKHHPKKMLFPPRTILVASLCLTALASYDLRGLGNKDFNYERFAEFLVELSDTDTATLVAKINDTLPLIGLGPEFPTEGPQTIELQRPEGSVTKEIHVRILFIAWNLAKTHPTDPPFMKPKSLKDEILGINRLIE